MRKNSNDRSHIEPSSGERLSRFAISPALTARSLEFFVTVAREGSMSAAAERLRLTQPAISQAIGALEASLGVQLFDRSVRPPALTLQAGALLPHAIAILESLQKFDNALRLGHLAQLPALRIGMLNSVATTIGPVIINSLREMAAEVSVDSGFFATRFQSLSQREFDFIITADEASPPPDVQIMPILTEPLLIIVPASYEGDPRDIQRVSETLDHIRFGRDPNMVSRVDIALQARGMAPQRRFHLDTNEGVLQMVAAGAGWTVLPVLAVIKAMERGEPIRVAPYPEDSLVRSIFLAMRRGDGMHVGEHIHDVAITGLRESILPKVKKLVPEVAARFRLDTLREGAV
ncbi:LysR family transcriptional regulator [Bosea sp. BK604]|uniref:LysR family transcriptional regulator n=1 Tax=Bosea sp. BK604 TaxID=2512180 RepID=UPI00104E0082|nr:LysR family transcriptional regulator [Bosea sp. BK604]TCR61785.1 DNA-binding transcriptional LysR family regulator [Bosea sp. BK604]